MTLVTIATNTNSQHKIMKTLKSMVTLCLALLTISSTASSLKTSKKIDDPPRKPHIIFIYADDWGYGDLTKHGNKWVKTPNLDRMAAEGADFHRFNVVNPVCSPSRAALITGQYPARYSIHQHFDTHKSNQERGMTDWLDPNAPTLPRMLKASGYTTAHYGKWHLTNSDAIPYAPRAAEYGYDDYGGWNGPPPALSHKDVFAKTLSFIEKAELAGKPAFINLWMHQSHTAHTPSEESKAAFSYLNEQQQIYAAVIKDGDDGIGQILDGLEKMGLTENTIIFFSSDNGPEHTGGVNNKLLGKGYGTYYSVGETDGLKGQKRSLYEGGIRVPFLVRWPGKVPANYNDNSSVITAVDMLPTICSIAGATVPAGYEGDGEDRSKVILGTPQVHTKPVFWDWRGANAGTNWPRSAVRDGKWKLLSDNQGKIELYNMDTDPKETRNVASSNQAVVEALVKKIVQWKSTLPKTADPNAVISKADVKAKQPKPYTFMWWQNSLNTNKDKIFGIKTDRYSLSYDFTHLSLNSLVINKAPAEGKTVLRETNQASFPSINKLPLRFGIVVNGVPQWITKTTNNIEDCQLIETGKYFQRRFLNNLPELTNCDKLRSGLEISSWNDRLSFLLKFIPINDLPAVGANTQLTFPANYSTVIKYPDLIALKDASDGSGFIILKSKDATGINVTGTTVNVAMTKRAFKAGEEINVGLIIYPVASEIEAEISRIMDEEAAPMSIVANQIKTANQPLDVTYDSDHGWYKIALRNDVTGGTPEEKNDRMERVSIQLENPSEQEREVRLNFAKGLLGGADKQVFGITGISAILRDQDGNPLGIPIQLSKNWHANPNQYFQGPWYHGFTTVTIPAESTLSLEYTGVNANWGGIPAASHAQLCLVGWGGNQQWEESAIGSWGESITYAPDLGLGDVSILDYRPLMILSPGNAKWGWTGNFGGADILNITNTSGVRDWHTRVRTDYKKIGPNLTEVLHAGTTEEGAIDFEYTTSIGRSEDLTRGNYHIKMKVLKDITFNDFVVFQNAAAMYHFGISDTLSWGNEQGLKNKWKSSTATTAGYKTPKKEAVGSSPWFAFTSSILKDSKYRAADKGFVIRNWKSKINGQLNVPPYFAEFKATEGIGKSEGPKSIINITTPAGVTTLKAGDFIETDIEMFLIPKAVADYYGPNQPLKDSLQKYAGNWKMTFNEAIGNSLVVKVTGGGKLIRNYPIKIEVDNSMATFSVKGGKGYVPLTFSNVSSPKAQKLYFNNNGNWEVVNQEKHGKDFWQVEENKDNGTWDISYNINLDQNLTEAQFAFSDVNPDQRVGLSALSTTVGLKPDFNNDSLAYRMEVLPELSKFKLTATALIAGSTLTLNPNGTGYTTITTAVETNDLDLNFGDNTYQIKVVAPNTNLTKTFNLTINRPTKSQTITFSPSRKATYGDPDFDAGATSETSETNPIKYTSSNADVATVTNGIVHIASIGTTTISASQDASLGYSATSASQTLTVQPKVLTITADNKIRNFGTSNPPLTAKYSGFVATENETILEEPVSLTTTATRDSPTGNYPITVTGGMAKNYSINRVSGVLSVRQLEQPMAASSQLMLNIKSDKGSQIIKGETANLTASGADEYEWNEAVGILSNPKLPTITVQPSQTTSYTVIGKNSIGQTGTSTFKLEVKGEYELLNISNVITPNGDGKNDTWTIEKIENYPNNRVKVADRAGNIVFEMIAYNNSWTGTFAGSQLAEGTYSYVVDFGPEYGIRKGTISIVKQ